MDTNINSNLSIEEATELAEVMTAEHEAHIVNDEIDAHKINNELSQVAETFDALEADGVDLPAMSPEDYKKQEQLQAFQNTMAKYFKSKENHEPGKEFRYSDATYVVQDTPHRGMWVKNAKQTVTNPNLKNKSVRRKLAKNPTKYNVVNL
jgi:hypothetical protein